MTANYLSRGNGASLKVRVPDSFYDKINQGQCLLSQTMRSPPSKAKVIHYLERGIELQGQEQFYNLLISGANNKRKRCGGNILSVLLISVILLVVTIGIFMGDSMLQFLYQNQNGLGLTNDSKQMVNGFQGKYASTWDSMYLLLFLGLMIMGIIGASVVQSNKILLGISIVGFALMLIISSFIGMATEQFSNMMNANSQYGDFASRYPSMDFVNHNLLVLTLMYGALLLMGMFFSIGAG